ncbi:MAG: hypothetical protein JNJ80_07265 [Gemmatimonadetes bacterium]|nr:hypothetical protein [Gemmatimonadota bacterium]
MTRPTYRRVAGPEADGRRPRLLLLSYHFPPGPAVGGLRWLRFAQMAVEHGWAMDVITADPEMLGRRDEGRLADLPPDTRVFGVHAKPLWFDRRPGRPADPEETGPPPPGPAAPAATPSVVPTAELKWELGSILGWRRMARVYFHVARERAWSTAAAAAALDLARTTTYDAVISSGPPHQVHLAATAVGRAIGRPSIVDFRDPWSTMRATLFGLATPLWPMVNRCFESRALRRSALAVFNTDLATEAMRARYPNLADRFLTVMNGADDEPVVHPPRDRFVISYAGNIYIDRNPRTLFQAARRVIDKLGVGPEQFRIEFMGHADRLDGQTVAEIAAETGVGDFFTQHPVAPRQEALRFLARATVLVSLPQSTVLALPSKAFEYLAFEAWPLLLAAPESATARVFRDTSIAVIRPEDVGGIEGFLEDRYRRFAKGERPGPIAERDRFSRRGQAMILFNAIGALTGPRDRAGR